MAVTPPAVGQTASRSVGDELRQLLRLGVPIALVQLGTTALNFVDVAMLGHYRAEALPAMSLGNTLSFCLMVFCIGTVTAVDPLLSQAIGARELGAIPRLLGRALLLCVWLALPVALLLLPADRWLAWCGQPPELIPDAAAYARLQGLAVLPFLWYGALRSLLSAKARIWPQLCTIVAGNLANAGLDWLLIFGHWGCPELGATGAALATVVCRWLMLFGLLWFGWRDLGPPLLTLLRDASVRASAFAWQPVLRLLRLGASIGGQFLLELGVFGATALLIGSLDAARGDATGSGIAGHQIALQLASLSFMVPLGLGMAASVRVGWATGRGDLPGVARASFVALVTGATVMAGFMLLFLLAPNALAAALTSNPQHVAAAAALIPIAGVFQIGDGLQVVAIGCLRGLGDVRSPLWANVVGFWLLGLPLGCWLAFGGSTGTGAAGLWWGLVVGLFVVAVALLWVLRQKVRELRPRLSID
jgi:multidrug resistance protein, MATE family